MKIFSKILEMLVSTNYKKKKSPSASKSSLFLPYDPATFSMAQFFRPHADIVASYIVQSGMEGIDRYEISRRLGINAECKAGNRIVSASIHAAIRNFPNLIGEYHKMEGRFRVKKFECKKNY